MKHNNLLHQVSTVFVIRERLRMSYLVSKSALSCYAAGIKLLIVIRECLNTM